jgi:uncharacterized protein (TIGR03083 family)
MCEDHDRSNSDATFGDVKGPRAMATPSRPTIERAVATIAPRYGGAPVILMSGAPDDQLLPLSRQRHRLDDVLRELGPDEWAMPSRCAGWSIKDVAAHLVSVNRFWTASVRAGLAGSPTSFLANFDPVATPEQIVAGMRALSPGDVMEQFTSSNEELLELLGGLTEEDWAVIAEAPPGHLPIRLLAAHALWDAWVHERDVGLPLGCEQPVQVDEVAASLRYVCALTSAIAILTGRGVAGTFEVDGQGPESMRFVLDVADAVVVQDAAPLASGPVLRGDAVALIEALSTRIPFPTTPPAGWVPLIEGLATAFDMHR